MGTAGRTLTTICEEASNENAESNARKIVILYTKAFMVQNFGLLNILKVKSLMIHFKIKKPR
jgi:rRNA maturation endonuclease Nob1